VAELWTVSEVAEMAHVTVRTLHHYDEIGLLTPCRRSDAGYRLYDRPELDRLHQILLYRELGFSLDAIGPLLDQSAMDRCTALRAQRALLEEKQRRTDAVIRAIDAALQSLEGGRPMETREMFSGFEGFDHAEHAEEARERWGDSDAYRESMRRARKYGKKEWSAVQEEADGIMARLAELMAGGATPASPEAVALAEEHRRHIDRWFYPCSPAMHAGLADMYEADARFGEYFEQRAEGLTGFVAAAIRANADRSSEA
jgi:DNA-binding transcriptional MerR regulator